jgi:hypothetical protein
MPHSERLEILRVRRFPSRAMTWPDDIIGRCTVATVGGIMTVRGTHMLTRVDVSAVTILTPSKRLPTVSV